ncbi:DUF2577 domain-containing protein [Paenibacillus sp. HN-1]|uniref:DUF2577 domain-containing protein n=1 Tax=Paenibacillus TaxID=44249 RepID=UPI001CA828FE|nr:MULTISPECIES: DUF2577 domain-containing protein [Paenibacillus]MBY9078313.1 DUF2577 domain-containing protein [Paenibacillus sp. CGMCC 1.18879]MBY9086028.1 DUF2577 domain-containing protein [Paenibacillus sinensis]
MLEAIKRAAQEAVAAAGPVIIQMGIVTSVNPLKVIVDNRLELTKDVLLLPESLTELKLDLSHAHSTGGGMTGEAMVEPIILRNGLSAGDKLLLIRMQGGQRYVVIDRLVSP